MGKVSGIALLAVLAGAMLGAQTAPPAPAPASISPKSVAAAGTKYVDEYAARMMFVVGDEIYTQETFDSVNHRTGSRMMKGELFLTFLQADRAWVAVHDIAEIDGEPVPDRQTLPSLLARGALASVVAEVVAHNAHFNIGRIERTFNEPTLALLVLDKSHVSNFRFTQDRVDARDDVTLVTLAFVERDRPTIVVSKTGEPFFARGELLIEAETGRVRATHIVFKNKTITADLMTTYALDPRLDLWLPSVFAERYEGTLDGLKEIDTGRAQYSNFKRYETSGRIKKQ
jgi:hypothetical protein